MYVYAQCLDQRFIGIEIVINPLQPGVAFLYSLKISGFLMFSGSIEKQHQVIMG